MARDRVPPDWLSHEYKITQIVHHTRPRVPWPYELVQVNGRIGIVYERVGGPKLLDQIGPAPQWAGAFGHALGRLHADMHARAGAQDLPRIRDRLRRKIETVKGAPPDFRAAALDSLEARIAEGIPMGDQPLHGDFHPDNIIQAQDGAVIIDWPDASGGHPLADVARTLVLSNLGGVPPNPLLRVLVRLLRGWFTRSYLAAYFSRAPFQRQELDGWLFPVLFARLSEEVEAERPRSIAWLKKLHTRSR